MSTRIRTDGRRYDHATDLEVRPYHKPEPPSGETGPPSHSVVAVRHLRLHVALGRQPADRRTLSPARSGHVLGEGLMTDTEPINVEAGDYIEDDPKAWDEWLETVRRYVPAYQQLVPSLGADGAGEVVAGTMLSYLADRFGIYLLRGDMERVGPPVPPPHHYGHGGMARHHHDVDTGKAIWWLRVEQFGGERVEHQKEDCAICSTQ